MRIARPMFSANRAGGLLNGDRAHRVGHNSVPDGIDTTILVHLEIAESHKQFEDLLQVAHFIP